MRTRSPWFIFFLVAVAQFMVVLDVAITNVALPTIQTALGFSTPALQWVVTAYALTFGGFLLLGGRASDLFGHKRVLIIGLAAFTFISFLIGISNSSVMLIVLRAIQGMAAALMSPAALSVVLIVFQEGEDRNRALGWWTTIATGGAAAGLLLGGILTQYLGWRWNFFVNVPIGILTAIAIQRMLPAHENLADHSDLDLPGAALITSGLVLAVYVISEAPQWGWLSSWTLGLGALAIILIVAFTWNESISRHPLIPLSIFKKRNLTGANLMMAPIMAGAFGMFFLISLYIQRVINYPPVITGLSFLPFPVILGFLSPRLAGPVTKYGLRPFLIGGPLLIVLSMGWLVRLPVHGNYVIDILPNIIFMPIGMALTFMPLIVAATSGVADDEAGLASGLINTSQQMGGAIGLAILSSVAAFTTASNQALGKIEALVLGYDYAFLAGVILVILATIVGLSLIREKKGALKQPAMAQTHL